MPFLNWVQAQAADVRTAQSEGPLILTAVPDGVSLSLLGKALYDAGVLDVAGDYQCDFFTNNWQECEVVLKPSDVTGTFAPTLVALLHTGLEHASKTAAGANFADDTEQVLLLQNLRGLTRARVKFTIPSGGDLAFDLAGSPPGRADFNGL